MTRMNKKVKKQFWLTKEENDNFHKKAEKHCMNEAILFIKMIDVFEMLQSITSSIMNSSDYSLLERTVLPQEMITAIEERGFFDSIPL